MKTRIRCAISCIWATFSFLLALGTVCYEWGRFEDFAKVENAYKFICVYEGLLVLLTIWCFFNHPYYTRKVLLTGAIYSTLLPILYIVLLIIALIDGSGLDSPYLLYHISNVSLVIVSVLLFWSAHKEKRVIPQSSKAGQ
ncbi:MAG TPA: hypothetical protein IAD47_01850 [Candidatus Limihabitans stercoravium]|nr:hypothetical protein [Candidatus Limihabitans stercoravium]